MHNKQTKPIEINSKVGKWLVLEKIKVIQKRSTVFAHYLCRCECGVEKIVRADGLRNGKSSQCSDCRKKERYIDTDKMIGVKIGCWLILKQVESSKNRSSRRLLCKCKCGSEVIIDASKLKLRKNNSCRLCNVTKHGYEGTSTYNTWRCMKLRCYNKNHHNYSWYGGRGIKICDQWLDFKNFLKDMGERPIGMQIDRINNNGDYEHGNCHWVTPKVNSNNRRSNKKIK